MSTILLLSDMLVTRLKKICVYNICTVLSLLLLSIAGCQTIPKQTVLQGKVQFGSGRVIYIEKQPIHYKYAPKKRFKLELNSNEQFKRTIPLDSAQLSQLVIEETSYPIYLIPGDTLTINTEIGSYPDQISISGYPDDWQTKLHAYLAASDSLLDHADTWDEAYDTGLHDSAVTFHRKRISKARQHLSGTPFKPLIYKAIGEYLVKRLTYLKNKIYHQNVDPSHLDSVRQQIVDEAKSYNFFSFSSLRAQRAGIFDFANAYAFSHGIERSLEEAKNQELSKSDVKRLAYPQFDSLKTSLLKHIKGRRAQAYARMHLIAERIGEMPLSIARPTYTDFIQEYQDYPAYTSFLKEFYERRKRVSPGQPAIPFTLPTSGGDSIRMEDFRGKYVLLDFWASWCIPCLNEFPHMQELYHQYPRSQFEIIGISIEKDSLRWRQALQRFDLPWLQAYGGEGFQQKTFSKYQAGGIPFYILVDPEGNILRYNDVRPSFDLPRLLDSLLAKPED